MPAMFGVSPSPCRNIMVRRMPTFSANDSPISCARFGPMPGISVSQSGCASNTSSVFSPKCFTISFAVAGPTPRIIPEARYFSMSL